MNAMVVIGLSLMALPLVLMFLWKLRDIPNAIIYILRNGDTEDKILAIFFLMTVAGVIIASIGGVLSI